MNDAGWRARAEARRDRMTLRKGGLHDDSPDLAPIAGADAVALVEQLTAESWALAGREVPSYPRSRTPCRFVPRRLT